MLSTFWKIMFFSSSICSIATNIEIFDEVLMGMVGDCRGDSWLQNLGSVI
jgi:hypothetical protein